MKPLALLLLAVFLVSTAALFAHRALLEATPLAIAAWRLGLAALFFAGWGAVTAHSHSRKPQGGLATAPPAPLARIVWVRLAAAGLCLAGHFLVWFAALQVAPVARATLLVCTTPLWTTLGGVLLRRHRFTWAYGGAGLLAAVGIGLVTRASAQPTSAFAWQGDALATLGGVLFAAYLLSVEGLHVVVSSRRQVTVAYCVAAGALWAGYLAQGGMTVRYSAPVWGAILGMTIGPQILGHTLLNSLLRQFPSSVVAFSLLLEPLLAAILAWALLGQTITGGQAVGGVLVMAALGLVIARQTAAERVCDEPVG